MADEDQIADICRFAGHQILLPSRLASPGRMQLSLTGATFFNYQIFALITTGFTWAWGGLADAAGNLAAGVVLRPSCCINVTLPGLKLLTGAGSVDIFFKLSGRGADW